MEITYRRGLDDAQRPAAARIYDEAFAAKLRPAIKDDEARRSFLARIFEPTRCFIASEGDRLLGIAGFHDAAGSITGDNAWEALREELGFMGAIRAAIVFSILERRPEPGELLMDGIAVDADARGRGIGTGLFAELETYARNNGLDRIHLEVIDTNPNARRLYERLGFVATKTEKTPYMKRIMGFTAVTSMVKTLD